MDNDRATLGEKSLITTDLVRSRPTRRNNRSGIFERFVDCRANLIADSTAWATQVRLLAGTLVRRLNSELGEGTVTRVKVRGPEQPRRPGEWRVRGGRGPRDTYG